jgi:hypothetical protein
MPLVYGTESGAATTEVDIRTATSNTVDAGITNRNES